ncbi:MAG TPA: mechanosensitive ion channel domain-containing protein, partial [Acidimicrobiia bacterium]|nr:mechanosensitive ion channel domain-containing protein [Acidimicrobiia bacterium]
LMAISRREPGLYFSAQAQVHHDRLSTFLEHAMRCLDLSEVSPTLSLKVSVESMVLLKEVLDRIDLPEPASVPDTQAMAAASLDRWRIPHTEIVIAKVAKGDRAGDFLFSPATLQRLPEFYEKVRDRPYKPGSWEGVHTFFTTMGVARYVPWKLTERLPPWAKALVWEQALWRWIVFGSALLTVLGAVTIVRRWINRRGDVHPIRQDVRRLVLPVSVSLAAWFLGFVSDAINITGQARDVIATGLGAILFVALAWSVLMIGELIAEGIVASPRFRTRSLDEAIVRLTSRILALISAVLVTVYGAQSLGLPVVPLLAGLGVGGLALALAAQPTIENLIAALTLHADRPVRVGDFCRFGDALGIVEEIGMRSTRIRTLDHTVLSVSNADFSKGRVENYSARRKMWYHPRIRLRYETTPDQVRYILVEIRKLLYAHPRVLPDPARIRFVGFGEYSLDLDVFAYVDTKDYGEYLEIAEDLNLRIMDVVKAAGTELAIPARLEYQMDKAPLDEKGIQQAEAHVEEWRGQQAMYLPKFPPETIANLRGSLDYPPAGSPGMTGERQERDPSSDTPRPASGRRS